MSKPRLLDLFCGPGGCAAGYAEYFDVTGVDHVFQPHYPYTFIKADALTFPLDGYDAYHASPPCQHFTSMLNWDESYKDAHPDYIDAIRQRLKATGKPYIIENVVGARKHLVNPIMLCGTMFPGLRVRRHRLFETSFFLFQPGHDNRFCHSRRVAKASRIPRPGEYWSPVGCFGHKDDAQKAMGIDWMQTTGSRDTEIANAIPPAYTKWIGGFLLDAVQANEEVAV